MDIWNQLGGNPAGSGFRFVNSMNASALRSTFPLPGPTGTSSPVLGPDGTIYIGTANGRLLALDPGQDRTKWNIEIAAFDYAVQTPAVADDGTVYCLCTSGAHVVDHRTPRTLGRTSFVVSVSSNGTIGWQRPIRALPDSFGTVNCKLNCAPRIISGPHVTGGPGVARIIFSVRYELIVDEGDGASGARLVRVLAIVDEHGTFLLFNRYEDYKMFVDAGGGGGGFPDLGGAVLTTGRSSGLPADARACADTPVVDGSFPATQPWTIIAPGDKGLYALKWNEANRALAGAPALFPLENPFLSPVVFPNGLLVGMTGGFVTLIDPDTLNQFQPNSTPLGEFATVAGGPRLMYFLLESGELVALDVNGSVHKRQNLVGGSVAFPALSGNHVHVLTTHGLETFSLDLQQVASVGLGRGAGSSAGFSSPAIGPNGEIYAASGSFPPESESNSTLFSFFDASPRVGLGQMARH